MHIMKKLLFGALALFIMSGCSGKNQNENVAKDSNVNLDSVITQDTVAQITELPVEAPQPASDTTPKVTAEKKKKASLPSFREFERNSGKASFFRKHGFEVSEKYVYIGGEIEDYKDIKASYGPIDGVSCKFKNYYGGDGGFSVTIKGAPELLDKIYQDAKSFAAARNRSYQAQGSEEEAEVTRSGNTVKYQIYNIGS